MTILASVNNKTVMPGITPIADVPDAPTIGTATASGLTASITFTAATTGGTPTTYTATSNPGSLTGTASSSPVTVSGLTGDTSYTFTVTAGNSTGTSPSSSASNSITAISPLSGGYDSLATVIVPSGGVASVSFTGIPTGYKHLQIRANAKTNRSDNQDIVTIRYNGDTGANYSYHMLTGNGSVAGTDSGTSTATPWAAIIAGNLSTTNMFGGMISDVLDYSSTSKYKTIRTFSGTDQNNTAGRLYTNSNLWQSTSAIASILLTPVYGSMFMEYSSFALYGVK